MFATNDALGNFLLKAIGEFWVFKQLAGLSLCLALSSSFAVNTVLFFTTTRCFGFAARPMRVQLGNTWAYLNKIIEQMEA